MEAATSSVDGPPAATAGLLTERLDRTAATFGEHLAIAGDGTRLTWAEVRDQSRTIARSLLAHGIGRGDKVGVWMPNHPRWLLLWLACVRIGATLIPVNTRYKADEAAYVLGKADARVLFIESSFLGFDYAAAAREIGPGLSELGEVVVIGGDSGDFTSWERFEAGRAGEAELEAAERLVEHDDAVIIVFTSGTTGFPKGVVHDHDAVRMMETVAEWLELTEDDRVLGHLPLFHVSGVFSSFLLALMRGAALIQVDRWDADGALRLIERERVSVLSGIPTHFIDLLRHPGLPDADVSSLRTGWIGGSYIPPEVMRGARDQLGMEALLPVYGMTETTSCTTLGRKTDDPESLVLGKGVPLGGYEVEIVDPETRESVATGTDGEIAGRGNVVMKGYYEEPEATAAVIDDRGWFYTGDIGVFDETGYLSITGRRSDKLIVGGYNVHPADVERVLLGFDGIQEAHVVGAPDERFGEVVVAFVELSGGGPSEAEIKELCKANMAGFKVPRRVILTTEWPMTPTGKIETARLRELAVAHA